MFNDSDTNQARNIWQSFEQHNITDHLTLVNEVLEKSK